MLSCFLNGVCVFEAAQAEAAAQAQAQAESATLPDDLAGAQEQVPPRTDGAVI